jgi:hypothetical protein
MEKVVLGTMPDRTSVCGVLQGHVPPCSSTQENCRPSFKFHRSSSNFAGCFEAARFFGAHSEQAKSVAGPMGGTAGPISRTVQGSAKENYRLRSDERDRHAPFDASSGPTTGTHIHLPDGVWGGGRRRVGRWGRCSPVFSDTAMRRDRHQ